MSATDSTSESEIRITACGSVSPKRRNLDSTSCCVSHRTSSVRYAGSSAANRELACSSLSNFGTCQVEDGKEFAALGSPRGGQFKDWLSALAISPDESTVAAADIAGMVNVWRLA